MSSKDNLAMDDAGVTRWDRPRWISVFSSHNPTIREVTECLGLGLSASSSTTNRGIPKFDNPDYRKLSGEVTRLSKELPKERDALLDFAADPASLEKELEELLATYGPAIWGRATDRSCLLAPDPAKKTYRKDLFYEDPEDKETLKIHLHRWIIIKACYYIRNMKLKRPSSAADYDTLADMEGDGDPTSPGKPQLLSPNGTPQSLTPPGEASSTTGGAESTTKSLVNGKKRKSSVYASLSDGEESGSTPAKRLYQSHTMPAGRKSPRKSIRSLAAESPVSENIPPVPSLPQSQHHTSQQLVPSLSAQENGRPLLTPLSSNELNGVARSANAAAPSSGFTAVNTGSFTAVNSAHSNKESPPRQLPSQSLPATNPRSYSSPYDSNLYGTSAGQNATSTPKAPALNTAPVVTHGFQAINSPTVTNGVISRNSPIVQHSAHAQVPVQALPQIQPQAQAKPPSRSNTPAAHHTSRGSLSHNRTSRSNTPHASAASAHPVQPVQPAPPPHPHNIQPTLAPAPAPTPPAQAVPPHQAAHAPHVHHAHVHSVPTAGAVHYPHQTQPVVLKSHSTETATIPSKSAVDISLLQCEVLGSLMQYLFPKPASPPDEGALFHKLETLWYHNSPVFQKQIGPLYELQSKVLSSWILERRKIAQLRHTFAYAPGVPATDVVDRLLALNDLRIMRLKWKNMSSADGLSAEDLLCRTFTVMTNTEGTEYLFKDGLDRLNDGVFEYLKTEDMRILMHRR